MLHSPFIFDFYRHSEKNFANSISTLYKAEFLKLSAVDI